MADKTTETYYTESGEGGIDLRYPEIAYNKYPIYRPDPGVIPFYIPALYPYLADSKGVKDTDVKQNNSGMVNKEKVSVDKVTISNCINIPVPRELCSYLDKTHGMKGTIAQQGTMSGTTSISGASISGSYSASTNPAHGAAASSGSISMSGASITGSESVSGLTENTTFTGSITLSAVDNTIKEGSAWVVVFIGGDINKPVILGRYYNA